jgi:hypothetical protein
MEQTVMALEPVPTGGAVEIASGYGAQSDTVTFAGAGTLKLDQSTSFSGQIVRFTGLQHPTSLIWRISRLDREGLWAFSESSNNLGGTLTASDGVHAVNIALLGNYMASSFVASSDGFGGLLITVVPQAQAQVLARHTRSWSTGLCAADPGVHKGAAQQFEAATVRALTV